MLRIIFVIVFVLSFISFGSTYALCDPTTADDAAVFLSDCAKGSSNAVVVESG